MCRDIDNGGQGITCYTFAHLAEQFQRFYQIESAFKNREHISRIGLTCEVTGKPIVVWHPIFTVI